MNLDDGYVPETLFGKDHFSTLAYAETVMVDCGGFQVGADPHMRAGRRHFRVMMEECRKPKRVKAGNLASNCVVMDRKYSTALKDGTVVDGHDDFHCLQDLAAAGYFETPADEMQPGVVLKLSDRGREVVSALRNHKTSGGTFASFEAPDIPASETAPSA